MWFRFIHVPSFTTVLYVHQLLPWFVLELRLTGRGIALTPFVRTYAQDLDQDSELSNPQDRSHSDMVLVHSCTYSLLGCHMMFY